MIDKIPLNKTLNKIPTYRLTLLISFLLFFVTIQLSAQNHKEVIAVAGDGIYGLLRKNDLPLHYVDEFIALNKDKLNANNELIIGKTYKLPIRNNTSTSDAVNTVEPKKDDANKTYRTFPIFGIEHEKVAIENESLKGAVYYLVAGHGGPDPGAVATYKGKTLCEDEYAYDITLRLARELVSFGATVYMITRDKNDGIRDGWYLPADKDEKCYPNLTIPINQSKRLRQRKDAVNKLYRKNRGKYQRLIVIHVDSRSKREKIDVFFYYDKRSKAGKQLCLNLRSTFDKKYQLHQPGRGYHGTVTNRSLYMLKYPWPVASFIELGNIQHSRDIKRFIIEDNRQALANWLSEGLILDFKNEK